MVGHDWGVINGKLLALPGWDHDCQTTRWPSLEARWRRLVRHSLIRRYGMKGYRTNSDQKPLLKHRQRRRRKRYLGPAFDIKNDGVFNSTVLHDAASPKPDWIKARSATLVFVLVFVLVASMSDSKKTRRKQKHFITVKGEHYHRPHAPSLTAAGVATDEARHRPDLSLYSGMVSLEIVDQKGERLPLLGALAVLGGLVYLGYQIGNKVSDINDTLKQAVDKLDRIASALEDISASMKELVDLIKKLPAELQGILEQQTIDTYMGLARSSMASLEDAMSSQAYFESQMDGVASDLKRIQDALYVTDQLKGTAGWLKCSAMIAAWTHGNTNLQRLRKLKGLPAQHPYTTSVHRKTAGMVGDLLNEFDKVMVAANADYAKFPHVDVVYQYDQRKFTQTNIPYQKTYPLEPKYSMLFTVMQWPGTDKMMLCATSHTAFGNGSVYIWCFVDETPGAWDNPALAHAAVLWWNIYGKRYNDIQTIFGFNDGLKQVRPDLETRVLSVPEEWQGDW